MKKKSGFKNLCFFNYNKTCLRAPNAFLMIFSSEASVGRTVLNLIYLRRKLYGARENIIINPDNYHYYVADILFIIFADNFSPVKYAIFQ